MKTKLSLAAVFGLAIAWSFPAGALPPLPPYVEAHYAANPEFAKFVERYKGLDMEQKCDACHKPGIDKKVKGHGLNDYGQAVAKNFKHRDFNKADKLGKNDPAEVAKARQIVADALAKTESDKNADGKTYGELLKAGQMPGKN